jgi:hypothetical protein
LGKLGWICNYAHALFFKITPTEIISLKWMMKLNGVPIWINGVLIWINGVPRWINGVLRWINGVPRWINGVPRWINGVLRWINGVLRWINGVLRWINGVPKWMNGVPIWMNEILTLPCPLPAKLRSWLFQLGFAKLTHIKFTRYVTFSQT